ncbi:unnamed protein product [Arabidopsis arenosa]|uniref:RING-type domain-containing protein n=1 Tax=Arabidopsis arenosa TaxID=38785 RepID=A0A8S1ZNY6_ARAAE|nr:unnamed protein product [Arabidopsis arenosa]
MVMEAYRSGLVAHPKRTLAGKFFTSVCPPSFDRTEIILQQQWKLSRGFKVFAFEKDDIILFEFRTKRDKKKVVKGGPWNIDGILLVLKECPQDISLADIDFSVACFWVKNCGKPSKQRPLTREFKTHVYGPWLRYDPEPAGKGLPVKPNYFELCNEVGLEYEETLTYAQFLVGVEVDVIYASEHEWGGKKLIRSLLITEYDYCFRFPCSPTRVIKDVLALEVDKISPLARLTAEDKASIVCGFVDHLMTQRETWSKKRWVPLLVRVEKTILVPPVDMETMLQEAKDKELHETINSMVIKLVDPCLEKSDDLLMRNIRDGIGEVGLTHQVPDFYIEMLMGWVKDLNNFSPRSSKLKLHPDHNKCVTVLGLDMDLFGTCCVCQEDFFLGEEATLTYPCSHAFHTCCIEDWIQQSQKCPLCRLQLQVLSSLDVFS